MNWTIIEGAKTCRSSAITLSRSYRSYAKLNCYQARGQRKNSDSVFNCGRVLSSKTVIAKSAIVLFVVSGFRQWKP